MSLLGQINKGFMWFVFSAFYIYNLLIMGFALGLYKQYGKGFLYTTVYACIISVILQIVLAQVLAFNRTFGKHIFHKPESIRLLFFVWSDIILVLESRIKIPKNHIYLSFLLFGYLALISVSKAALGAMIILFAAYILANKIISSRNILVLIVVGGLGFIVLTQTEIETTFNSLNVREVNEGDRPEENSEWQYRGYDRITNHPLFDFVVRGRL